MAQLSWEGYLSWDFEPEAAAERDAIIAAVYDAFHDVKRGPDATSWNETILLDGGRTLFQCLKVRKAEKNTEWQSLVDDPTWDPFPGSGGFTFVNPAGFHYYLPPALVRFLRGDGIQWYPGHLVGFIDDFYKDIRWSDPQLHVIARLIVFMASNDPRPCRDDGTNVWEEAIKNRWYRHLPSAG